MDLTDALENSISNIPEFKKPYKYCDHYEFNLVAGNKRPQGLEIFAESDDDPLSYLVQIQIGDIVTIYDPGKVVPSEKSMQLIRCNTDRLWESISRFNIHTLTTLTALGEIRNSLKGKTVMDLGSGSGILALSALKFGASHAILIDQDPDELKLADELMNLNGFERSRYTLINGLFSNMGQNGQILPEADIGVANIGAWEQYDKAHLEALRMASRSGRLKVFVAGGYGYSYFGLDHDNRNWQVPVREAKGEKDILNTFNECGLKMVRRVDGHALGLYDCSRAFIASKDKT